MNISTSSQPRGVALILVMIMVVFLTIHAGMFSAAMRIEAQLALNARNSDEVEWLARSGMEYAKWFLAEDLKLPDRMDTTDDKWAGGSGGIAVSNSPLADLNLPLTIRLGKGSFTLDVMTDHESKLNINLAARDEVLLQRALSSMGSFDAGQVPAITSAIRDWIDRDNSENLQGAEDGAYPYLDPPDAKNGPIDDLGELLNIPGLREFPELVSPTPPPPVDEFLEAPAFAYTLSDVFTPLSAGSVNLLTANSNTLAVLFGDPYVAGYYIQERQRWLSEGRLGPPPPAPQADGLLPDEPGQQPGRANQMMSQQSMTFDVTVTATSGQTTKTFVGTLVRINPNDIQLVKFSALDPR